MKHLLPFLLLGLMASCQHSAETAKPQAVPASSVSVAVVERADLEQSLTLTAEFVPFEEVDVMAKVSGYVRKIYVDAGTRVAEGQLLAELDVPEMRADLARSAAEAERRNAEVAHAREDLRRAESAYKFTHQKYDRLAAVAKQRPGLVAQQEIDDAQGRDLAAEAQVASAKTTLNVAQQQVNINTADTDRLNVLYAYTKVVAPFAGVVTRRYADTGSMIQAGTASQTQAMPLIKLSRNQLLRLTLPVPESAVPSIKTGTPVEVRVPALKRNFSGQVARFTEKINTGTRTMATEVDVPNPGLVLVPGMYAEVDLSLARRPGVLAVPVAARQEEGDHFVAYVVNAKKQIEIRRVRFGLETADALEVLSGLAEGEQVVVSNRGGLKDGASVEPKSR